MSFSLAFSLGFALEFRIGAHGVGVEHGSPELQHGVEFGDLAWLAGCQVVRFAEIGVEVEQRQADSRQDQHH